MHGPSRTTAHRFGPFALDAAARRLTRDGGRVYLPDRQMDVLVLLAAHLGQIVHKEAIVTAAWDGVAVGDSSITNAIYELRKVLGLRPDGKPYIETLARKGYRLVAEEPGTPAADPSPVALDVAFDVALDTSLDAALEPYRAFVDGRAALETLDRDAVARARAILEEALRREPDFAAAHIAMANVCVLTFESTRADAVPDLNQLQQASLHAREGCRLLPSSGDAWSTLAFVSSRTGQARDAIAAARKALTLDPDDWCHHVRLAFVSWGGERVRAAHRALALCPGLALAHWLAATVFVGREAFDRALEELRAGCASQDQHVDRGLATGRFAAVGLHLLHGLVLGALGRDDEALAELARELAEAEPRHVYGRESCANSWYTTGALHLRNGRIASAQAAFQEALTRVPGHALASVGLHAAASSRPRSPLRGNDLSLHDSARQHLRAASLSSVADTISTVDAAIVMAAALALAGKHAEAARVCGAALMQAEPGQAGWLLPVEPLLQVAAHRDAWSPALAILRSRAM